MKVTKLKMVLKKADASLPSKVEVTLPTELSVPSKNLADYSMLVYGEKKIGKTSLASQFPNAFFLMCEPGGKALSIYQRPVTSWEEFKKYLVLLKRDKSFKTVVVDTVDIAYKLCVEYVCKKLVIDDLSEEEWGKGWKAARDEFSVEISKLLTLDKGVIFISHAADKEIKTRTGDKYHKVLPTMSGQARDILEGIVDIWAYYSYQNKERILVVQGDDHIGAGNRLQHNFQYSDGTSISEIPMGKSPQEAFSNFTKAFNNTLQKGGTAKPKLTVRIKPRS